MIQNIIQELMKKMNITEEQAKGGLGLLLKFCQDKLAQADFKKITDLIGSNWQELLKNAPSASAGLAGKLGGIASLFGEKAAQMGSLAGLAGGFSKLGIEMKKIQPFVDTTLNYLQEKGGPQVKEMLAKFLNR